ncbi:MAG: hypothetical protein QW728_01350, partial [Thermoplasmata archaeon]
LNSIPQVPPRLTNASVTPTSGNESTVFVFRVTYSDYNNDPAVYVNVNIMGTSYNMTTTDGRNYTFSFSTAPGVYSFNFTASDGYGVNTTRDYYFIVTGGGPYNHTSMTVTLMANRTRVNAGGEVLFFGHASYEDGSPVYPATVIINNISATLLPDGNFSLVIAFANDTTVQAAVSDGHITGFSNSIFIDVTTSTNEPPTLYGWALNPLEGNTTTYFNFTVYCTDPDDTISWVRVIINGTARSMSLISGSGGLYFYNSTFSAGTYYFSFSANDSHTTVSISGGSFTVHPAPVPNRPPVLSGGGVNPPTGNTSTTFRFTVTYSDPDGDSPAFVRVNINGTSYNMTVLSGNEYEYSMSFPLGTYYYNFSASDGQLTTYTSNSTLTVSPPPVIHTYIRVTLSANTTSVYAGGQVMFTGQVVYEDGTPVPSATVNIGTSQTTTLSNGSFSLTLSFTLNSTVHASASKDSFSNTSQSITIIVLPPPPPPNHPPVLSNPSVQPATGYPSTTFTFKVLFSDPDGDDPAYVRIIIDDNSYDMVLTGTEYTFQTTLSEGEHTYSFEASDGSLSATADGGTLIVSPPPVNRPPELLNAAVVPSSGGNIDTVYNFSVMYKDPDNDAPLNVTIFIDSTPFQMLKGSGSNYAAGVIYYYTTKLSAGAHTITISAMDSNSTQVSMPSQITVNTAGAAGGGGKSSSKWWLWVIVILAVILVGLVVAIIILKKKHAGEEEKDAAHAEEEADKDAQEEVPLDDKKTSTEVTGGAKEKKTDGEENREIDAEEEKKMDAEKTEEMDGNKKTNTNNDKKIDSSAPPEHNAAEDKKDNETPEETAGEKADK